MLMFHSVRIFDSISTSSLDRTCLNRKSQKQVDMPWRLRHLRSAFWQTDTLIGRIYNVLTRLS